MSKRIAFLLVALLLCTAAFAGETTGPLKKVEPKTVCMVNEHAMGKDQIPVQVDGKTYYGCCEMCKKALATDATKRSAVDPVSGMIVDKAVAVIAAQEDGKVFYFENDANLAKYNEQLAKK
jgi:YHS domain-containing protein